MDINAYAKKIYQQNVERGWWDDPDRCRLTVLQLVNTEIAEATEGDRKGINDDHLPHRKMAEVELADTLIRLLDLGGAEGWTYIKTAHSRRMEGYTSLPTAHFFLTFNTCLLGATLFDAEIHKNRAYSQAVQDILYVAETEGYDLQGAVDEKLAYNQKRADHNRENRAADGGKRY